MNQKDNYYIYYTNPNMNEIDNNNINDIQIHQTHQTHQTQIIQTHQTQDDLNVPDDYNVPQDNMNNINSYNNTDVDYNITPILFNALCNFLLCICFIELCRNCYIRYKYNQTIYHDPLLIENNNNNYNYNKIIIKEQFDNDNCSICLENLYSEEDLESNNDIIELNCKHMFHKKCLDPWVNEHKKCPLCKCDIK